MPFGLINSGASFVRLIKMVLDGKEDFSDSFIDDIIIFSDEWNIHIQHLDSILDALKQAHLTAKPSKCFFAFKQLEFWLTLWVMVKLGLLRTNQSNKRDTSTNYKKEG